MTAAECNRTMHLGAKKEGEIRYIADLLLQEVLAKIRNSAERNHGMLRVEAKDSHTLNTHCPKGIGFSAQKIWAQSGVCVCVSVCVGV